MVIAARVPCDESPNSSFWTRIRSKSTWQTVSATLYPVRTQFKTASSPTATHAPVCHLEHRSEDEHHLTIEFEHRANQYCKTTSLDITIDDLLDNEEVQHKDEQRVKPAYQHNLVYHSVRPCMRLPLNHPLSSHKVCSLATGDRSEETANSFAAAHLLPVCLV